MKQKVFGMIGFLMRSGIVIGVVTLLALEREPASVAREVGETAANAMAEGVGAACRSNPQSCADILQGQMRLQSPSRPEPAKSSPARHGTAKTPSVE
jgi:hypothetical protein